MYNIEMPETITINLKYLGEVKLSLAGKSVEWLEWAIGNGIRQSVADADAGKAGTDEGKKAVTDKWNRIKNGEVPSQRGGGHRLSYKDKAERSILIDWLVTHANMKVDTAKKQVNKATSVAWRNATRIILINTMIEAKLSDEDIKAKLGDDLITRNIDSVKAAFADDIESKAKALEAADKGSAAVTAVDGLTF